LICWLTALCVKCSLSAAARKFCSSATARKAGKVFKGKRMVSYPGQKNVRLA
jgi:hypothetical protein